MNLEELIRRIEVLPDAGDGMTIGAIAEAVDSDPSHVTGALEEIVERDER